MLCIVYDLQFLDSECARVCEGGEGKSERFFGAFLFLILLPETTLSYASIMGIQKDIGLVG